MPSRFKHVGLIGKYQSRGGWPVLDEIAQFLLRRGLEVSIEKDTAANTNVSDFEVLSLQEIGRRCDLAVVVGGDGTMLAAARELARHNVPLIGINQGRLGFITPLSHNFCEACNRVRLTCTGTLHTCLGREDASDLRAVLRGGADDAGLAEAIRLAVDAKPQGHDFRIERAARPAVARHMSTTGG